MPASADQLGLPPAMEIAFEPHMRNVD